MAIYRLKPTGQDTLERHLAFHTSLTAPIPPSEGIWVSLFGSTVATRGILAREDVPAVIEELSGWLERTEPH